MMLFDIGIDRGASFSKCRKYRYRLWRVWNREAGMVTWIGLNPSTADEEQDDPTIRRCIQFAKDWGYGGIWMTNLFAWRATDPAVMKRIAHPIGPENDLAIANCANQSAMTIAAWGIHGEHLGRDEQVLALIGGVHCLGVTDKGLPRHPLYVRGDTRPVKYERIAR